MLRRFVVPSTFWPRSREEKEEIMSAYRSKLKTIDCRHFDQGRGTCPFGSSCFYRRVTAAILEKILCARTTGMQRGAGDRLLE